MLFDEYPYRTDTVPKVLCTPRGSCSRDVVFLLEEAVAEILYLSLVLEFLESQSEGLLHGLLAQ